MQDLKDRILRAGPPTGRGLIKVDSFLNHQVDPRVMQQIGAEFARRFKDLNATKVLTAETGGIPPALMTAVQLDIPLVIARKTRTLSMPRQPLRESTLSTQQERIVELLVSPEFLQAGDRVLIIDDFLSSAQTLLALVRLVNKAGAQTVGVGAVIEKVYEHGRQALEHFGVPVESLVTVERLEGDQIIFRD